MRSHSERVTLTLLGGFAARLDSGRDVLLPRRKARALLAYLGLRPDLSCSRETVTALLWGDVPAEQGRHSLRQTLVELRHALPNGGRAAILVEGDRVALNPSQLAVDVMAFERLARRKTRQALERAAELYAGDLLAGLSLREAAFEEWLRAERDRLREAALQVLSQLLAAQTSATDLELAVQTAMRLLALEPMHEAAHRALMDLYDRLGRRSAALRQYQRCAEVLQQELGVAPEAKTLTLYARLAARTTGGANR